MIISKSRRGRYKNTVLSLIIVMSMVVMLLSVALYLTSANVITGKIYNAETEKLKAYEQTISNIETEINNQMFSIIHNRYLKKDYRELNTDEKLYVAHSFFDNSIYSDYVDTAVLYYAESDTCIVSESIAAELAEILKKEYNDNKPLGIKPLYVKSTIDGDKVLSVMVGFPSDISNENGALIFNIDFEKFFMALQAIDNEHNINLVLDDTNNVYVDNENIGSVLIKNEKFIDYAENGQLEKGTEIRVNGKMYIVNAVRSPMNNFIYVSMVDKRELFGAVRIIRNVFLAAALLTIIICALMIKKSLDDLYKPIRRMSGIIAKGSDTANEYDDMALIEKYVEKMIDTGDRVHEYNIRDTKAVLWSMILNICHGIIEESDEKFICEQLKQSGWDIDGREFVVIIIEFDNDIIESELADKDGIDQYTDIDMVTIFYENKVHGLISYNGDFEQLIRFVGNIHISLEEKLHSGNFIGIGNSYKNLRECGSSYREALEALQYKHIHNNEGIIHINDCVAKGLDASVLLYCENTERKIVAAIKSNKPLEIEKITDEINVFVNNNDFDEIKAYEILKHIVFGIIQNSGTLGIESEKVFSEEFLHNFIQHKYDMAKTVELMRDNLLKTSEYFESTKNFSNEIRAEKAKKYIDEHYSDPLTREELASVVKVSPAYMTTIFKSCTGMNMKTYITQVRMEKAAEMLKTSKASAAAIGERVGYEVSRSFYRAFKTYYGVTPDEYRKKDD